MKLIGPFRQILTMNGLPHRGAVSDEQLEIITNGGILVSEGKIIATGDFSQLKIRFNPSEIDRLNTAYVAIPGMIDVHTHICWAGSRADDYALQLSGKSYLEIAALGGGIWRTVQKTRDATIDELVGLTAGRANILLRQGITTIEVKSGYGLSVEQELKILESIKRANDETSADLISTCLAAHIVPKDFHGTETDYLDHVLQYLLPLVIQQNLSRRTDIFIDTGAFSIGAAKDYLLKAKAMGFAITIHGDQFTKGVVQLANELGALSIDHLESADDKEIEGLGSGDVIPVVLPGASIGLGCDFAPARKILDAGNSLVIASDWNPGSAPMGNLLAEAAILGSKEKLTMAEIWAALTYRAARALKLSDRGILKEGFFVDIAAFKTDNYKEILYNQGQMKPEKVWKKGYKVV